MGTAIRELLGTGCIWETVQPPRVVNPLSVSARGDKKRLILDLRYVNDHVLKQRIKFDDWRVMEHFLTRDGFMFSFDIKQGYHHIEMDSDSVEYLGFAWEMDGRLRYFVFLVLPFGLTSAPYIFTKVLRSLVKFWRGKGIRICCFIDDGCGVGDDKGSTLAHVGTVRDTLGKCGFVTNEKSIWDPTQELDWIGYNVNLREEVMRVSQRRATSLKAGLANLTKGLPYTTARDLAKLVGKIISTKWVLGEVTQLKTRHIFNMIKNRRKWDSRMSVNHFEGVISELVFWRDNFDKLNHKPIPPSPQNPDWVIASDASSTGLGAHTRVGTTELIVRKNFSPEEAAASSTHREAYAIMYALASFTHIRGSSVLWLTDNFGASRAIIKGSSVPALQDMAEKVYDLCQARRVTLKVQWVPRESIQYADHLSKLIDHDDWRTTPRLFNLLNERWGPYTVDRFADSSNTKLLRFNSKFLCPNTEQVDAFSSAWTGENNYLVPPVSMIPRVLTHMEGCGATGTLVVPFWPSAAYFPLIMSTEATFKPFVKDSWIFGWEEGLITQGENKKAFIGSDQFKSDILAAVLQF